MLTPSFKLSQTDDFLTLIIKAPFAKIDEADILVEDNEFKFYSKPYYLRLTLPGNLIEDGRENATYDVDSGSFLINIPKAIKGENFEGLSMLTKLLAPSGSTKIKSSLIEVIDTEDFDEYKDNISDDEFDWHIEQEMVNDELNITGPHYGFANQRCSEFQKLCSEFVDVIDLQNPDVTPSNERRILREEDEILKFSDDHYLADLHEKETICEILEYKTKWHDDFEDIDQMIKPVNFNDNENEKMRNLPKKEYLLDKKCMRVVFLSLIDILYAYAYNHRTTFGENTVESGWTMSKLSGSLSWMDTYTSIKDVYRSCFRRSLCYPLYRHWKVNKKIWRDTYEILSLGRDWILKCLLEIYDIFLKSETHYILNNLFILDYCVWIQSVKIKHIKKLCDEMIQISFSKSELDLEIPELELAGKLALKESKSSETTENVNELSHANLNIAELEKDLNNICISDFKQENVSHELISNTHKSEELSTDSSSCDSSSSIESSSERRI